MRKINHPRSRRALFWGLTSFAFLQLALSAVIAVWKPNLRDPHYFDKSAPLKARTVGIHPRPLTVLALGTSRTDVGVRTQILEEEATREIGEPLVVYNFGVSGAGPLSRLVFLRRLLAEGVRPDVVLVEVLPPMLNRHIEANEFSRLPGTRLAWEELEIIRRYDGPIDEAVASWWFSWLVPWYQHRFVLMGPSYPTNAGPNRRQDLFQGIDGWGQRSDLVRSLKPETHEKAVEKARQDYQVRVLGRPFQLSEKLTNAYREILATCQKEGITAVVLCMPEGPTFRGWYPQDARIQIDGFLNEIGQEFGVPVVNCQDWCEENEFRDSHHLIKSGAERFSRRLGREVVQPLIRDRLRTLARQQGHPEGRGELP